MWSEPKPAAGIIIPPRQRETEAQGLLIPRGSPSPWEQPQPLPDSRGFTKRSMEISRHVTFKGLSQPDEMVEGKPRVKGKLMALFHGVLSLWNSQRTRASAYLSCCGFARHLFARAKPRAQHWGGGFVFPCGKKRLKKCGASGVGRDN